MQKESVKEVLGKCHLLGQATETKAVNIPGTPSDLFNVFLVEMPLAPFFQDGMSENTLGELSIEIPYKYYGTSVTWRHSLNSVGIMMVSQQKLWVPFLSLRLIDVISSSLLTP